VRLASLNDAQAQLRAVEETVAALKAKLSKLTKAEAASRGTAEALELLQHEVSLLSVRVDSSAYARLHAEAETHKAELDKFTATAEAAFASRKAAEARCQELERCIKDFEKERANQTKEIEKSIAKAKKDSVASGKMLKDKQTELGRQSLELEQMGKDMAVLLEQQAAARKTIAEMTAKEQVLQKAVSEKKTEFDAVSVALEMERDLMAATDKQIGALKKKRDALNKESQDQLLEIKKIEVKLQRGAVEQKEKKAKTAAYLDKYDWISGEKQMFGRQHTDYDFATVDPKKSAASLARLQEEQGGLAKRINKKVMGMFEKAEQEFKDLVKKRDIIDKDKKTIEQVIIELDVKKNEALKSTWQKVNKDFGAIFSTLLPGTNAKLEPTFEGDILEGLEVKVAFGDVWKESLTELSGGQRSLLALSLILALLLFKPAPMYILDEIDAALDLSHTQNIGQMIKSHFSQSQFIVVSLKEGMFNNANVVFRTKFVEGVSAVSRTIPQKEDKENVPAKAVMGAAGGAPLGKAAVAASRAAAKVSGRGM
jgi:structural maintenance of chromosome 2